MNRKSSFNRLSSLTGVACASAFAVLLLGCRSATYMKADTTAGDLQRAGNELRAEVALLESVTNSLNDLIANPGGDLRIQFGRFTDALEHLEKTAHSAAARSGELRKDGENYFKEWDRQLLTVSDEQIHQASANRKADTMKLFDTSMQRYDEAQNAMTPLIAYLRDIRTALSVDLTTAGLQSAKVPAANATQQAVKAREALLHTMADLDALAAKMCFFVQPAQSAGKSS